MQKWEYTTLSPSEGHGGILTKFKANKFEEALNALGAEGWELVRPINVSDSNDERLLLIFKRPLT